MKLNKYAASRERTNRCAPPYLYSDPIYQKKTERNAIGSSNVRGASIEGTHERYASIRSANPIGASYGLELTIGVGRKPLGVPPQTKANKVHLSVHGYHRFRLTAFFLLSILFYQNSLANELQSAIVFEISHTFKLRQLSFLKIYQDGKVHYHKYETDDEELSKTDNLPKDHYAQLSKSQVDELINEFLSLPFKELAKYEPKKGNEIEDFSINFKIGHVKMSISDRIFHMALFTKLRKYLAKELKAWFCSPEGNKYFDKNCPDYLYLPENFKF